MAVQNKNIYKVQVLFKPPDKLLKPVWATEDIMWLLVRKKAGALELLW